MAKRGGEGTLYAVGILGRAFIKIGCTYRPVERRVQELQKQSPCPLVLLASLKLQGKVFLAETQVKNLLSHLPHSGEWFSMPIMDYEIFHELIHVAIVVTNRLSADAKRKERA